MPIHILFSVSCQLLYTHYILGKVFEVNTIQQCTIGRHWMLYSSGELGWPSTVQVLWSKYVAVSNSQRIV